MSNDEATQWVMDKVRDEAWFPSDVALSHASEQDILRGLKDQGLRGAHLRTVLFLMGYRMGYAAAIEMWPVVGFVVELGMNYRMVGERFASDHLSVIGAPWMLGFDDAYRAIRQPQGET